mgnify:CR=1 FL=1
MQKMTGPTEPSQSEDAAPRRFLPPSDAFIIEVRNSEALAGKSGKAREIAGCLDNAIHLNLHDHAPPQRFRPKPEGRIPYIRNVRQLSNSRLLFLSESDTLFFKEKAKMSP